MRRNNVTSTSFWCHVPARFLINQCQIITFLILKYDNIENSRIELKGIRLQVLSNQIKVTFIIILPFNLVHLCNFFPVSHRNWTKIWVDYWGAKGYVAPPPSINWMEGGGGLSPALPTPLQLTKFRSALAYFAYRITLLFIRRRYKSLASSENQLDNERFKG